MLIPMSASPKKQSGAAMVVGLIVLLIMTLLGVSSMGSMTTELKMAANVQNQNTAFQAATAAIEAIKADPAINWVDDASSVIGNPITSQPATNYKVSKDNSLATTQATIVYSGCKSVVSGDSLTAEGGSMFLVHEIQVTGQALNSSNNVVGTSNQVMGLITTKVAACG
jgi:type IV pilus assembly protein PilX